MKTQRLITLWLALGLGAGLVLMGCSELGPTDPNANTTTSVNEEIPPCNLTHYNYPAAASLPPPGYQFIQIGANNANRTIADLQNGLDETELIIKSQGGDMWDNGSGIMIDPWGVPNSIWIGMTRPDQDEPWIDFEPHGLMFTGTQTARISYAGCSLPPGIPVGDLVVLYWNEEQGIYEYIGGYNNVQEQYIEYPINHFSRYVVAADF